MNTIAYNNLNTRNYTANGELMARYNTYLTFNTAKNKGNEH